MRITMITRAAHRGKRGIR